MPHTILIIGATGLFGGHCARALIADGSYNVICAGRGEAALQREFGARAFVLDRNDLAAVQAALLNLKPFAVLDLAGPFQLYGDDPYGFARAVIEARAHYIDIADAPAFVDGITTLDALAKANNVTALAGASSTPAISSVVADRLAIGMSEIYEIETAIVPGNRTPRGLSVMKAILSQAGQPFTMWRNGKHETVHGWDETKRITLRVSGMPKVANRRAALVNTPDVALFPARYGAKTVLFRAGLEIGLFHNALSLASKLVKHGLLTSLLPFAKLFYHGANLGIGFGSNVGGMQVRMRGVSSAGHTIERTWDLIAADGNGPKIPTQPVILALRYLTAGKAESGARPALALFPPGELEAQLASIGAKTEIHERVIQTIFLRVLGGDFAILPTPIRVLHSCQSPTKFAGQSDVDGGATFVARLIARMVGFPKTQKAIPVEVTLDANEEREIWVRTFGRKSFSSVLRQGSNPGEVIERFGPLHFTIALKVLDGTLLYPAIGAKLFGLIPIPNFLLPVSKTCEYVDDKGRFNFDVDISLAPFGRIVRYRGWLRAVVG